MKRQVFALSMLALGLAACGAPRPADQIGSVCKSMATAGRTPVPWPDVYEGLTGTANTPVVARSLPTVVDDTVVRPENRGFRARIASQSAEREKYSAAPTRILSISAGGAWGAFSISFLQGWGENPSDRRPKFDVVTGVSTGSMIAPIVFLDDPVKIAAVRKLYSELTNQSVFKRHSLVSIPWKTSIYDSKPLRDLVEKTLDDDAVEAIGREAATRTLAVMATNLDSGVPEVFDLTHIAADVATPVGVRRKRIIDAVMASAAIPIAFPPVFIDGNLYVDGGLRMQVFFTNEVLAAIQGRRQGMDMQGLDRYRLAAGRGGIDLSIVLSGDMQVDRSCIGKDRFDILAVLERTATIAVDQLQRASVDILLTAGRLPGNTARYVDAMTLIDYQLPPATAAPGKCLAPMGGDDQFDPKFEGCLADAGYAMGRGNPIPWRIVVRNGRVSRPSLGM